MLFFPCRSYVSTILPQVHRKYKKPMMTEKSGGCIWFPALCYHCLLCTFVSWSWLLILTPLVMVLGHYEWSRSEVHCYCRRSSQCCQLYRHSPALIPVTSSTPHPPLHHIKYLSNFALGRLIPQQQSLSRGANLNKLNEKLVGAKVVAKGDG